MAINLIGLVSQVLTPQVVARIAATLGISPAVAQKLVDGALPAILASLGGVASTPGGAQKISDAVSGQDSALLDNLLKSIGGAGQSSSIASGAKLLGSLLGDQALGQLGSALGKFAGADPKTAGSILALAAPAVIGTLGQQDPDTWSDGNALAKLLEGQKTAIAATMSAGLGDALASTGLLKGFEGASRSGAAAATGTAASAPAASTVTQPTSSTATGAIGAADAAVAAKSGGIPSWVWVIAVIVVIALLAWFFYFKPAGVS